MYGMKCTLAQGLLSGLLAFTVACSGDDGGDGGMPSTTSTGGAVGSSGGAASGGAAAGGTDSSGGSTAIGGAVGGTGGLPEPEPTADSCGPEASVVDGVLTAFPHIEVSVTPETDFALKSFNFTVKEDGDSRGPLLSLYAEMENIGTGLKCKFIPEVYLDFTEIITLADGPAYHLTIGSTMFSTTDECIRPGESVVLGGVQRGVTEEDLMNAMRLTIDAGSTNYPTDEYNIAVPPSVEADVVETDNGYAVAGNLTYVDTIYNQAVYVFPKDARGLIVDELVAFPGDLGTHFAGSTAPFETESTSCRFVDYELYQTWILDD